MVHEIDIFRDRRFDAVHERIQERLTLPENLFGSTLGPDTDAEIILPALGVAHDVEAGLTDDCEVLLGERNGLSDFVLNLLLDEELAYLSREMRVMTESFIGRPAQAPVGLRGVRRLDRRFTDRWHHIGLATRWLAAHGWIPTAIVDW